MKIDDLKKTRHNCSLKAKCVSQNLVNGKPMTSFQGIIIYDIDNKRILFFFSGHRV
jgi:hypothetical protein